MRSDTNEDEIMVLSAREIVRLCKGMHMSPLKFKRDGIVLRKAGDRWMNMDWTVNRISTRVKGSSAGKSVRELCGRMARRLAVLTMVFRQKCPS